jgi:hypothetical protein
MMQALQANQAFKNKGMTSGLCLGMYKDAYEYAEACVYCPLNTDKAISIDTCSLFDAASFCALVKSWGVDECHARYLSELQAGADCILRDLGCFDTCSMAFVRRFPAPVEENGTSMTNTSRPQTNNAA